jgi:hypothetical protein
VTTHEHKAWLVAAGLFFTLFLLMGSTVDCVGLFFTPILNEFGCVLVAALLLLSTSPLVLLGAREPNISLLCVIGYALTFGLPLNASFTLGPMLLAESLGPRSFGLLAGMLWFFYTFVSAAGPVLVGALFDLTNSYVLAFEVCAVAYAIAAIAATTISPADGRDVVAGAAAEIYAE